MRSNLLSLLLVVLLTSSPAAANDPLDEAKSFLELGKKLVEQGTDDDDDAKIKEGLQKLREAKKRFEQAAKEPGLSEAQQNRIRTYLLDVDARIDWYAPSKEGDSDDRDPVATGEVRIPEKGDRIAV